MLVSIESARKHLRGLQRAVVKTEKINDVTHDEINGTVCPDCNFSNSTSSKYCNQCGVKLNVSI
jgi:ribosomal protein L40E